MKGRTIYIIGVTVFLVVIVLLTLKLPRPFVWQESYDTNDPQPYGSYVFDSLMRQSLPNGYTVTDKTLTQLRKEKVAPRNILFMACRLDMDSLDMLSLQQLAEEGNRVMVATQYVAEYWLQRDLFKHYGVYFMETGYRSSWAVRGKVETRVISWPGDSLYERGTYQVYVPLVDAYLLTDTLSTITELAHVSNDCRPDSANLEILRKGDEEEYDNIYSYSYPYSYSNHRIGYDYYEYPVAVSCRVGKGEIVFVSTPLLLTNYGILMPETRGYVLRLMNAMADRPVVRTTAYNYVSDNSMAVQSDGATDFFLQHPPLRTALQLTGLLVLLLMVFKARRRQRAIPVYRAPANRTLEFVQLIGTLYYQRHDNHDLMKKKYRIFAETLRRRLVIDVMTAKDEAADVEALAQRTHLDKGYLTHVLRSLRNAYFEDRQLGDVQMKRMIEQMNEITEKI